MRQWLTITAGGLCLTLASSVQALGVGEPQQVSPLNRPLHVLLPLTDGAGLEPSQISVAVADDAAYRQSGLSRSAMVDALSAKVVRQNGSLMLVIDSPRRVREPFLDLLLVVTWPDGQWQRDVSLLFDPVDYASSQPLVGGDRAVASASNVSMDRPTGVSPNDAIIPPSLHTSTAPQHAQPWPTRLTVRAGDSLSSLAASLLPRAGMSRQAVMVTLFQANPGAFVGGDINRLRAGVNLDVPAADAVAAMPRGAAVATFQALARESDDGRPVIDIVGRDAFSSAPETSDSRQLAALERRLTELATETERQRAAILALQAERDGLQGALAAVGEHGGVTEVSGAPANAEVSTPAVAAAAAIVSAPNTAVPMSSNSVSAPAAESTPASTPVLTTQAVASPAGSPAGLSPMPSPTPSLWQRVLAHLDWIGGGLLIVLLGVWAWQRRRGRNDAEVAAGAVASAGDETPAEETPSKRKSSAATTRRVAAAAVDVDSASISQADIYMAYGRHAEARDWLRQQLVEGESAQLRLGLLRALGELRDLDGLEETLAGFGSDATSDQRREGQALVDDYRARHVEESWEEATAEVGEDDEDDGAAWRGGVADIDALFESQITSPPARAESPLVARREFVNVESERPQSPMSALLDDELASDDAGPSASDKSAGGLGFSSIDYVAPTLDFEPRPVAETLPSSSPRVIEAPAAEPQVEAGCESSSSTVMPTIDFSALSLEPGLDPAEEPALGSSARLPGAREARALEEAESSTLSTRATGREKAAEAGSGARSGGSGDTYREVPAGWDVEEVEFQSPHRDNGRP